MHSRNIIYPTRCSIHKELIGQAEHSDSCSGEVVHGASGTLIAVTVGLSVGNPEDRQCSA